MKIQITMKCPDAVEQARLDFEGPEPGLREDDSVWIAYEIRGAEFEKAVNKFVRYSEYMTVEIDTETGEARVLEA